MELVGKYYRLPVKDPGLVFAALRRAVMHTTRVAINNTRSVRNEIRMSLQAGV